MKRFIVIVVLVTFVLVSGCGLAYNAKRNELLKTAKISDYGPPPPANHCDVEKQLLASVLKDPLSAQYQWGNNEVRDIIQEGMASPNAVLVWITSAQINAKNGFGGYTGFKPYLFAWRNGKIYAVAFPDEYGGTYWQYCGSK
jgi:hypothetical protein